MKRNFLAAAILAILLVSLAAPVAVLPVLASSDDNESDDIKLVPEGEDWYKLETDVVTVLFPRGGQKPMFIWWYTGKPDQIYVVKYQGLIEYFTFEGEYYRRLQEEPDFITKLMILQQIMMQINETWHRPFFPFNVAMWSLSEIKNITTDAGAIIGVSFAFKLVGVPDWMRGFKFAENKIMIRVRFYNTTVQEKDPDTGYEYTVYAGEMKMDLVVDKWVWNIDAIKALLDYLRTYDIDINVPQSKTRLALWVNLASINITQLLMAEKEPEEIEMQSTTTHMEVEGIREDITQNMTLTSEEKPIEVSRPVIKIGFANETTIIGSFFRFVSSAKVKDFPKSGNAGMVPVKAAYIAAGAHMRLFIGYPYFGNGSLEHDPSIGVDVPGTNTMPQYTVQAPSGINSVYPTVIGKYVLPLFTTELAAVLVGAVSIVAVTIYALKWKRKTPVNMVGAS